MIARLPVLLYHRVGPPRKGGHPSLSVTPRRFESQLSWLARQGFRGISASTWLAGVTDGARLPPRPIVLTFDDGYGDLTDHAFPALEQRGWSATVFVATSTVGGASEWDEPSGAAQPLLSADDIRTWAARGIEFGAHGVTHCDLTGLEPARLQQEVVGAREVLVGLLGRPVTAFAYPYGSYDDEVRKVVGGSFELAFGVDRGLNDATTDRTRLRRTMVQPGDTTVDLLLRTRLGWSPLERVRARTRVRHRARRLTRLTRMATRRAGRRRPSPS